MHQLRTKFLVQQAVVAGLLQGVKHRHASVYNEHDSIKIPEKRALQPHGPTNFSYIEEINQVNDPAVLIPVMGSFFSGELLSSSEKVADGVNLGDSGLKVSLLLNNISHCNAS